MKERPETQDGSSTNQVALGHELWSALAEGDASVARDLAAWPRMMKACPAPSAALAIRFLDEAIDAFPTVEADVWLPLFDPLLETPGLAAALTTAGRSRVSLGYGLARAGLAQGDAVDPSVLVRLAERHAVESFEADEFATNARIWTDGVWERAVLRAALSEPRIPREVASACWPFANAKERIRLALAGDATRLFAPLGAPERALLVEEAEALSDPEQDVDRALLLFVALARADASLARPHERLVTPGVLARTDPFPELPSRLVLDALAALGPERRDALLRERSPMPWAYLVTSRSPEVIERAVRALAEVGELDEQMTARAIRRTFAAWGADAIPALEARLAAFDNPAVRDVLAFTRAWVARTERPAPEAAWKHLPETLREALREAWAALERDPVGHVDRHFQFPIEAGFRPVPRIVRDEDELARVAELRPELIERVAREGGVIAVPETAVLLAGAPYAVTRLLRLIELGAPEIILLNEIRGLRRWRGETPCGPEALFHLPSEAARAEAYYRSARLSIALARHVLPVWSASFPDDHRPERVIADAESVLRGHAPEASAERDALHKEAYVEGADWLAYGAARSAVYAHDECTQNQSDEQDTPCDLAVWPWYERATWAGDTPTDRRRAFWTWFLTDAVPSAFG
jgi:hypothetical protein